MERSQRGKGTGTLVPLIVIRYSSSFYPNLPTPTNPWSFTISHTASCTTQCSGSSNCIFQSCYYCPNPQTFKPSTRSRSIGCRSPVPVIISRQTNLLAGPPSWLLSPPHLQRGLSSNCLPKLPCGLLSLILYGFNFGHIPGFHSCSSCRTLNPRSSPGLSCTDVLLMATWPDLDDGGTII